VDGDGDRVDDNVPACLQPGEWRGNKGGQVLADFLLHSIDKRENRIQREKEAAHWAACTEVIILKSTIYSGFYIENVLGH
jgi:hypothetical protein